MKKLLIFIIYSTGALNAFAQANQSLSNLTNPTSVNQTLTPSASYTYDLGTTTKGWRNGYFAGSIYLSGVRFLAFPSSGFDNTFVGANSGNVNTGDFNVGVGYEALYNNSTGDFNTAVGFESLFTNTTGSNNSAFGLESLWKNTTGNNNTTMGFYALYNNTKGYSNVAVGTSALYHNTSGSNLVAVGDSALYNQGVNSKGNYSNTALGSKALFSNTTGYENTAAGRAALYSNTTGYDNTAFGRHALNKNVSGNWNTALGVGALYSNLASYNTAVGYQTLNLNTIGDYNTAVGYQALYRITGGEWNSALGYQALQNATEGYNSGGNTAIGYQSLNGTTTGELNTAVGFLAGDNYPTGIDNTSIGAESLGPLSVNNNTACGQAAGSNINGSDNTFIGSQSYQSDPAMAMNNSTAIGYGCDYTGSNQVRLGDPYVTSIGGYEDWSNVSDGRVKRNIKQNVPGLDFINKLQPITYNLDLDAADKIIDRSALRDKDGKVIQPAQEELDTRKAKEQIIYTGFAAQDVEKAAQSLNYDFSGVDKPANANTLYGLRYGDFVVPLVKAVQELSAKNDAKDATIASLQADNASLHQQLDALAAKVNQFESTLSQCCASYQSSTSSRQTAPSGQTADAPILEQNTPNPFSQNTTIQFYIPSSASDAMIVVSDLSGKTIQQFNHLSSGNGTITIAAGALTSGTYQYSLVLNGKVIDTKQMVLTK